MGLMTFAMNMKSWIKLNYEILSRIEIARAVLKEMEKVLCSCKLSVKHKLRILNFDEQSAGEAACWKKEKITVVQHMGVYKHHQP